MRLALHEHRTDRRCPFCRDDITTGDTAWDCPECGTAHHRGCAREATRCTQLGCTGTYAAPVVGVMVDRVARGAETGATLRGLAWAVGLVVGVLALAAGAFALIIHLARTDASLATVACRVFVPLVAIVLIPVSVVLESRRRLPRL